MTAITRTGISGLALRAAAIALAALMFGCAPPPHAKAPAQHDAAAAPAPRA